MNRIQLLDRRSMESTAAWDGDELDDVQPWHIAEALFCEHQCPRWVAAREDRLATLAGDTF